MMPFSVLRAWLLGTFSWFLLGMGIYCGWLAFEEYRRQPQRIVTEKVVDVPSSDLANSEDGRVRTEVRPIVESPRRLDKRFWSYAIACVALLGLNFGGAYPVRWFLGNGAGTEGNAIPAGEELWIDRPDGSRLHVQIHGTQNDSTLVLTHGWSLDVSAWNYVLQELSRRHRVVTWDLPGLGQSKGPSNRDWSLEKMAHDLNAVIEATAGGKPVVLGGHSIGGMITQVFCRLYRDQLDSKVRGLALLHTTYLNPLRTCFASSLATALELPVLTPLNYLTIPLAPWVWLSNLQSYLNGSLHITTRFSSFSGKQTWRQLDHAARLSVKAWPAVLARGNFAMQKFNEENTLSAVDLPVLVLSGKHDRMTLPSASAHMERLLPADHPCQIPSGHLGMFECSTEFAAALTEFLGQVNARDELQHKHRSATSSPQPVKL